MHLITESKVNHLRCLFPNNISKNTFTLIIPFYLAFYYTSYFNSNLFFFLISQLVTNIEVVGFIFSSQYFVTFIPVIYLLAPYSILHFCPLWQVPFLSSCNLHISYECPLGEYMLVVNAQFFFAQNIYILSVNDN